MKSFHASANGFSYTKDEYLNEIVTSTSSATSTISYNEALEIAQKIANSVAKNNANIINQTLDISKKIFYNKNDDTQIIGPLISSNGNIYICKNGTVICLYSDYTLNWSSDINKNISSVPVFDVNENLNLITDDGLFYIINKYSGSFTQVVNLNNI